MQTGDKLKEFKVRKCVGFVILRTLHLVSIVWVL